MSDLTGCTSDPSCFSSSPSDWYGASLEASAPGAATVDALTIGVTLPAFALLLMLAAMLWGLAELRSRARRPRIVGLRPQTGGAVPIAVAGLVVVAVVAYGAI